MNKLSRKPTYQELMSYLFALDPDRIYRDPTIKVQGKYYGENPVTEVRTFYNNLGYGSFSIINMILLTPK